MYCSSFAARGTLLALAVVVLAAPSLPASAQAPGPAKKALVVWGGWPGHQPKPCVDLRRKASIGVGGQLQRG